MEAASMTTPNVTQPVIAVPEVAVQTSSITGALWLLGAAFLGLLAVYFIGLDQGITSVLGNVVPVHEFVHDGRHLLGFPCH
jgi:cobalt transporter subunit CbtB